MTPNGVSAVIFDCDGVLVDSEALGLDGSRAALSDFGLDYPPEIFVQRFVGMHDRAFFRALRADYEARHGAPPPEEFEARILEGRRRDAHLLQPVLGALDGLKAARARFGALAVASSSRTDYLKSKLQRTGLYDSVEPHIYSADLVEHGKPAPDIFLHTAARLACAPEACLVLEDSENGVRAGVAAGMTVWGFTGGGHCFDGHGERLLAAGAATVTSSFAAFCDALSGA